MGALLWAATARCNPRPGAGQRWEALVQPCQLRLQALQTQLVLARTCHRPARGRLQVLAARQSAGDWAPLTPQSVPCASQGKPAPEEGELLQPEMQGAKEQAGVRAANLNRGGTSTPGCSEMLSRSPRHISPGRLQTRFTRQSRRFSTEIPPPEFFATERLLCYFFCRPKKKREV